MPLMDRAGLLANEAKESKHVLNMGELLAAGTCCDKFRCTRGVSNNLLTSRAPHDGRAIDEDDEP